ncbi:MAG: hybrid sensor histidine kinase/response regulator [Roseiflexaceae bacterium]|nr:hybrid sensor histidine kinase/response regulator [Roseiflexaceae bacterium]
MTERPMILYIEDNLDNQRLVQRILEARGYQVLLAKDGPSGLAAARETMPALILVDINIPGLDGYETTTRLRSLPHLHNVPIIALTADSRIGVRERSLVAGCSGYITKPIDPRRLHEQIQEFIDGKRELVSAAVETSILREYNDKLVERLERQVRELSAANAELQELDRLKSNFLATLSHELRTPLTSILGYLELFERNTLGSLTDVQSQAISVIARNSRSLSRLLNNLLYLQEIRSVPARRMPIVLSDIVQHAVVELQPAAQEAGVDLQATIAPNVQFNGDMNALFHAIRNLIDNAIKFNVRGGSARVTFSSDPTRVLLWVEDTGIGIPAEAIEKIFIPFYQVDDSLARPYTGAGLGLAITKYVAESFGGQVAVRSTPNVGSTFTFILPRT